MCIRDRNAMGLESVFKNMDDVKVPFADVRNWVTRLQQKAVPLEETSIKTQTAMKVRDLLNNTIEAVADNHPKLAKEAESLFAVSYTHLRAHETGRNLVC